jgi:ribonuclease D
VSDWEAATLTRTQLEYAAQDALVALQIFQRLVVAAGRGTQITCVNSAKVQILTQKLRQRQTETARTRWQLPLQITCFNSTKVQILTQKLRQRQTETARTRWQLPLPPAPRTTLSTGPSAMAGTKVQKVTCTKVQILR